MDQNSEKYFAAACGYVWKPLEQIGILDPTSAAKNYAVKQRTEKKLAEWAKENDRVLITGHIHRPMVSQDVSGYMSTGSCVHPYLITCIEVENDTTDVGEMVYGRRNERKSFCGAQSDVTGTKGAPRDKNHSSWQKKRPRKSLHAHFHFSLFTASSCDGDGRFALGFCAKLAGGFVHSDDLFVG